MAEPDIRVDTTALDRAGALVGRAGAAIAATARDAAGPTTEPAWADGFDSVAATARVGDLWRAALERGAADVTACGAAMSATAAAWRDADAAVAESLRAG